MEAVCGWLSFFVIAAPFVIGWSVWRGNHSFALAPTTAGSILVGAVFSGIAQIAVICAGSTAVSSLSESGSGEGIGYATAGFLIIGVPIASILGAIATPVVTHVIRRSRPQIRPGQIAVIIGGIIAILVPAAVILIALVASYRYP